MTTRENAPRDDHRTDEPAHVEARRNPLWISDQSCDAALERVRDALAELDRSELDRIVYTMRVQEQFDESDPRVQATLAILSGQLEALGRLLDAFDNVAPSSFLEDLVESRRRLEAAPGGAE